MPQLREILLWLWNQGRVQNQQRLMLNIETLAETMGTGAANRRSVMITMGTALGYVPAPLLLLFLLLLLLLLLCPPLSVSLPLSPSPSVCILWCPCAQPLGEVHEWLP